MACLSGYSQSRPKPPKPKKDFRPSGIRIGTDLIDLGKTVGGKTFKGWEINSDVDFANYYITADIGNWAKDLTLSNGFYSNGGNYFRFGVDINLLNKDPDRNMFFFGFRYGQSQFHESMNYVVTPARIFATPSIYQTDNTSVNGSWVEITSGLRVKVWKGLWTGYTARLKFAPKVNATGQSMAPYDMPGYGIVSNAPWWGFNYQVFWRFGWREVKVPPKK
ncbi:hypothetical protein WSM22_07340 [Cytophagales bacterium WSM2-2]|nr:hypothetical protein WSM22_07340 [Cytophagales bacterium WSM2-2]